MNKHHEIGIPAICAYTGQRRTIVTAALLSGDIAADGKRTAWRATHASLDGWLRTLRLAQLLDQRVDLIPDSEQSA